MTHQYPVAEEPNLVIDPQSDVGPVLVTNTYTVAPDVEDPFL